MSRRRLASFSAVLAAFAAVQWAHAQNYDLSWHRFGGGGRSTAGAYDLDGIIGQAGSGPMSGGSFEVVPGFFASVEGPAGGCVTHGDCADLNGDGIRDDNCTHWVCASGTCIATETVFADLGGANGDCMVDGVADGNDRFHALNCFSNRTTANESGYPCELSPPTAFNVDVAGLAAPCTPDGVCDGHDAFAAINSFSGISTCACGGAPQPLMPPGEPGSEMAGVTLRLRSSASRIAPGELIEVDVLLDSTADDLRGYQLHSVVLGENANQLTLVDQYVDSRKSHVFQGLPYWQAHNLAIRQMLVGLDDAGISAQRGAYLATLVYRASAKARGSFHIDLLAEMDDPQHRTVLFATDAGTRLSIERHIPVAITVVDR